LNTSTGTPGWGTHAPTWSQSAWIHAIRLAPPWLRRPLQRHFREVHQKRWTAPLDIVVRGLRFRSHFNDNTPEYKLLFQGRRLNGWHLRKLRPYFRTGGTFVDIGANFGFFSLNAAKTMGDRCRVVAIEPNCTMVNRLRENIRLNGLNSIIVRDIAIGAAHGLAESQRDAASHGRRGYGPADVATTTDQSVSMMPLLSVLRDAGIEKIDVLKIDIEGYEDQALMPFFTDAPESLWPQIIAIEDSHRDRWNTNVIDRLVAIGYRVTARGRVDHVLRREPASAAAKTGSAGVSGRC